MKVSIEWYGDQDGNGSKEHSVWTEMDVIPSPGDGLSFGDENMKKMHIVRRWWVADDEGWHVELVARIG